MDDIETLEFEPRESPETLEFPETLPAHESPEGLGDMETSYESPDLLTPELADSVNSPESLEFPETVPYESLDPLEGIETSFESPELLAPSEFTSHESPEEIDDFRGVEIPPPPEFDEISPQINNDQEIEEWEEIDFGPSPMEALGNPYFQEVSRSTTLPEINFAPTEYPRIFPAPGYRTMNTYWMG